MNLEFQESSKFQKDLKHLDSTEAKRVVRAIAKMGQHLELDRASLFQMTDQPRVMKLLDGLDSTLYVMKVQGNKHLRIIFTLDDDPLFDRMIFTLLRVVHHDNLDKTYLQVAQSLYRGMMDESAASHE